MDALMFLFSVVLSTCALHRLPALDEHEGRKEMALRFVTKILLFHDSKRMYHDIS